MRKLLSIVLALGVVAGLTVASFATFTSSVSKSTFTAGITFTGQGVVQVNAQLNTGSSIAWTGVSAGVTGWKAADTYIIMDSTITDATGGIQIYTDNKAGDVAHPYTGTANPAGLVGYQAGVPTASSTTLTMCWRLTDNTTNTLTIVQGGDNKLYSNEIGGQAGQYPCFVWIKDFHTPAIPSTNTTAFANGEDYVTVKDALRGGQHAEGTWNSMPSPDYIYFGAYFKNAVTPRTYNATLRVEAFFE
jgi:hypothetical protein